MPEVNKLDFNLDVYDLQTEIGKQSSTYSYYSDAYVECREKYERLINKIELTESQLELSIREKSEQAGVKLTEGKVKALVTVDEKLVALKDELVTVKKELGILDTAVKAMEHKKAMIQSAVSMAVTNTCGMKIGQKPTEYAQEEQNTQQLQNRLQH